MILAATSPKRSGLCKFSNNEAAIKMLWLAIYNIENKRARDRAKDREGNRATKRKAEGGLMVSAALFDDGGVISGDDARVRKKPRRGFPAGLSS